MKKRDGFFEQYNQKICNISNMLQKEGKSDGECRFYELVATLLLFIDNSLRSIGSVLFCLLGFVIGKFLSGLL